MARVGRFGFLVNPRAERLTRGDLAARLASVVRRVSGVLLSPSDLQPDRIASFDAIVVAGGDGTVRPALGPAMAARVPLLPFPAGTANDLAVRAGHGHDPEGIPAALEAGRSVAFRPVLANGAPFACYAAVGLGASASAIRARHRAALGLVRRVAPDAVGTIATLLAIAGKQDRLPAVRVAFGEDGSAEPQGPSRRIAGLYVFALDVVNRTVRVADGWDWDGLEIVAALVPQLPRQRLAAALRRIRRRGDFRDDTEVDVASGRRIAVALDGADAACFADGEPAGIERRFVFERAPEPVRLVLPAPAP